MNTYVTEQPSNLNTEMSENTKVSWSGTWRSTFYSSFFANGIIKVNLPDDLKLLNDTEVDFEMQYSGIYRYGSVEHLKGKATFAPADLQQKETDLLGTINMSMYYNIGRLSYNIDVFQDKMEGTYSLSNPIDKGKVQLKKGNNSGGSCIIL